MSDRQKPDIDRLRLVEVRLQPDDVEAGPDIHRVRLVEVEARLDIDRIRLVDVRLRPNDDRAWPDINRVRLVEVEARPVDLGRTGSSASPRRLPLPFPNKRGHDRFPEGC